MLRIAMLVVLVAVTSTAQAQGEPRTVITPATDRLSCGKWINTPKGSPQHEVFKKWVLGFVSGANFENKEGDFLRDRDPDGLTAWIDNYCRRNPLHDMTQALAALLQVLRAER